MTDSRLMARAIGRDHEIDGSRVIDQASQSRALTGRWSDSEALGTCAAGVRQDGAGDRW
jgi:hypothetical protein